ncbi:MAG: UvrD-helicase domain-containing protein [Lachnospiraceae bacterium]|nr:UvrD-helicase domain-containing protein [Lachnospiraceae bacterium]
MGVSFTPDQQRVIDTRNRNILVSAAAGSGKTAVLVERIIQKICDETNPVDIDRLLIVTFTSAAAAQMRERISKAVSKKLEEQPENEHLQKQSALIHNAQITTIDSFCLFVIRNNFNEIGLDPGFRVADEGEIKLLEGDVLDDLLEECHSEGREEFLRFVESYSTGGNEKRIEEAILRLYHFSISYPFPEEWLEARKDDYTLTSIVELPQKAWFQGALRYMETVLCECEERLNRGLEIASGIGGPEQYRENLIADLELIEQLRSTNDYQKLYDLFTYSSFSRLSAKKSDCDPVLKEVVKAIRDEVKKNIADLKKFLFLISPEDTFEDMKQCEGVVKELVSLTLAYKERLDAAKRDKNIVDFSDMEHFALQILLEKDEEGNLIQRETALAFQDYFEEIMIDEYQDSNEVQELLLKSISGEDKGRFNRFMVGDVKQSIYKFRLARPEIFMEKYDTYENSENAEDKVRIDLSMNFRSRREVTDATNFICGQIMKKQVGNVEYDEKAALYVGASYTEPQEENLYQTELLIATENPEEENSNAISEKEKEAYIVADRIRELVGHFPVTDAQTGELRPAKYSDIVILFRATAGWDEDFRRVLAERGIPVHITSKTGYFQTLEIQGIVNFLKVLNNPLQDIPFFGVMKLPFFDFSEEEIVKIRCFALDFRKRHEHDGKQNLFLYEQVKLYAEYEGELQKSEQTKSTEYVQLTLENMATENVKMEENEAEGVCNEAQWNIDHKLVEKAKFLLEEIKKYRARVTYTPIKELIQQLIRETGYSAYIGAMPGGEQRHANMELLLERAGAFEKTSFYGLFHFIRYLETMQEKEVDFGEANILDENADVVRVMTIHKSKGLEFPICFVCGLAKQFNLMDTRQAILMDVELGIGVDCIDPDIRTKRKTLRKNIVAQRMKEDTRGEDLRVLYVALTRAKEKLILTAYEEDMEKKLKNNMYLTFEEQEKLPYSVMMSANSYFDLILATLMRHQSMKAILEEYGLEYEHHNLPYHEIPIHIVLKNANDISVSEVKELGRASILEQELEQALQTADKELAEKLQQRLSFAYPHTYLEGLMVKTTVSELKKEAYEEASEPVAELFTIEREPYIPAFMREEETILGTQYGTAVHKAMELFSFAEEYATEGNHIEQIQAEKDSWIAQGRVLKQEIDCVSPKKIAIFLKSSLAQDMIQAKKRNELFKEQPFVLGISADKLDSKFPSTETVLIQGVIDAFYYDENGDIVLLDYKTDKVKKVEELVERYKAQLDYYQEALEQITGKKVMKRYIYSFRLNEEIEV